MRAKDIRTGSSDMDTFGSWRRHDDVKVLSREGRGFRHDEPAATGDWGAVVWAVEASGARPALAYFEALSDEDAAKMQVLFERLAERGRINNTEQFKKLGTLRERAVWEFKRHQVRFLGGFAPGRRQFVVAHGLRKKRDKLRPADIERAVRILTEHLS